MNSLWIQEREREAEVPADGTKKPLINARRSTLNAESGESPRAVD
jgi:hypothetical protein